MFSKIIVSALFVILVTAGSQRTNAVPTPVTLYKPSLAELTVPFRENPKILLRNFPGNSVVLNLLNGHPTASNYLVHLARQAGNSDAGSFFVEAPKDHGVMAVIQRLHLRRISDTSGLLQLVNNCKDYILFEGLNGEKTIPICGNLARGDNSFYPPDLHGPKFFNSPSGSLKVTFRNLFDYGNELALADDTETPQDNKEVLTVEIAFTAYSKCLTPAEASDKFQCTPGQCIEKQLACDEVINCTPGENQRHFGVDEKNCTSSFAEVDPNREGHDEDVDDDGFHIVEVPSYGNGPQFSNKPPPLITIIILVILLTFLTVCGYFWSWLSHVCCVLRGIFRSAEVGIEQQDSSTPSNNTNQFSALPPPRLPVAYYVPAVVLRATSSSSSSSSHNKARCDESDSPPPAYEMLFPPKS